ncbi:hypothetical protein TUN199_02168 [Pyrenophora tritici-repentis]|uniref:Uncharacterized protein n=1 Tax=Pyrenophora tritici-repentis TaxID=45151 RepID=A0A834VQR7_9PLEO|nr:hypothetical protein A1F99_063930 [Pyrenophora tritici-repentis]KAF7570637.1 hypothetical protein PtrM4_106390 [Pyrenophora tritici-repentis]KAI0585268.1 hypothetical protein Alg215_02659 [Pyrenophora tritici-repentis]KAI0590858.1 hypothetical protein Alg130_01890 [Pyrenophora tritici-repentis]KAI0613851.1 hypothetical protein TUN205_01946 [Pyrenophora tritici-repentis]
MEGYSPAHVKETVHFIDQLRARIASVPLEDRDKPMQHPLVEIGYSKRCLDRLKDHARHNSSTYIMNLTAAIFHATRNAVSKVYKIQKAGIYLIWLPEHAEISEIGLTKLAEGYIHNAGGFSHFTAGLSKHSANRTSAREWNGAKEYLVDYSAFQANLQLELDALEKLVLSKEAELAENAVSSELEQSKTVVLSRRLDRKLAENVEVLLASLEVVRERNATLAILSNAVADDD